MPRLAEISSNPRASYLIFIVQKSAESIRNESPLTGSVKRRQQADCIEKSDYALRPPREFIYNSTR
jgi:hypothetical protein